MDTTDDQDPELGRSGSLEGDEGESFPPTSHLEHELDPTNALEKAETNSAATPLTTLIDTFSDMLQQQLPLTLHPIDSDT